MKPSDFKKAKFAQSRPPRCYLCDVELTQESATVDHVHPRALRGWNKKANMRMCCRPCNQAKGDRMLTPGERQRVTGRFKPKQRDFSALSEAIKRTQQEGR